MNNSPTGSAPDYTNAALIMLGVNMVWIFTLLWALYGFVLVLVLALAINHLVERFAQTRGAVPVFGFVTDRRTRR